MTSNIINEFREKFGSDRNELADHTFLAVARRSIDDGAKEFIDSLPEEFLEALASSSDEVQTYWATVLALQARTAGLNKVLASQKGDQLQVSETDDDEAVDALLGNMVKNVFCDTAMGLKEKVGSVEGTAELAERFATDADEENEFIGIRLGDTGIGKAHLFQRDNVHLFSHFSDLFAPKVETGVTDDNNEGNYDFDVTLDDVKRNYHYASSVSGRNPDDVKWEGLAFTYLTKIARDLDRDLDETMDVIASEGYWSLPSEHKAKKSDALKEYFLESPDTQGNILDTLHALIERTEEAHLALGVKPRR